MRTKEGITEYLQASAHAYKTIQNLYNCATTIETRNAFRNALEVLPFKRMLKNGELDYFAIDNYMDEELVKSAYNNLDAIVARYNSSEKLLISDVTRLIYPIGESDRLKLENKSQSLKDSRKRIVSILDRLKMTWLLLLFKTI